MIPLLLVLTVLAVALVCFLATEVLSLHFELRAYRRAEADEMDALDQWATEQERKQREAA